MIIRNNIADLLDPSFREIHDDSLPKVVTVFEQIFNIKGSKQKTEKESGITGFGLASVKPEGVALGFDDPHQKYNQSFTHDTLSLGFRISQEAFEDDLSGSMRIMPKKLADSMMATAETLASQHFDRSQNGSYTGPDGKVLCATDHPRTGGGTQSNRPTANADLSVSVLESALTSMRTNVNDKGIQDPLMPAILLVPPGNEFTGVQLLKNLEKSGTANRDMNAIKTRGLRMIVWDFLSDTDSWYLLTEKEFHQLVWYWRRNINMRSDNDFHTDDGLFASSMRVSSGWVGFRGVYGSVGA